MARTEHPMRADAARNRDRILAGARQMITQHGSEVPMGDLAHAAGVAVGTLYRHFPTKAELVDAVLDDHIEQLTQAVEASWERVHGGQSRAMDEIRANITDFVESAAHNQAIKAAAARFGSNRYDEQQLARTLAATENLIHAAQQDGDMHPDITLDDFQLLFTTVPFNQPPERRARWVALFLAGFSTAGRTPSDERTPKPEQPTPGDMVSEH